MFLSHFVLHAELIWASKENFTMLTIYLFCREQDANVMAVC